MVKKLGAILLAGCLLGVVPASTEAANLSRLLRAERPTATARSSVQNVSRPQAAANHGSIKGVSSGSSSGALNNGTPRFPVLSKLIRLYLLWLLFNPYR